MNKQELTNLVNRWKFQLLALINAGNDIATALLALAYEWQQELRDISEEASEQVNKLWEAFELEFLSQLEKEVGA